MLFQGHRSPTRGKQAQAPGPSPMTASLPPSSELRQSSHLAHPPPGATGNPAFGTQGLECSCQLRMPWPQGTVHSAHQMLGHVPMVAQKCRSYGHLVPSVLVAL